MKALTRTARAEPVPVLVRARTRSRFPVAVLMSGLAAALVAGGLSATRLLWPSPRITPAGAALARVEIAPFGERIASVVVITGSGRWIRAAVHGGIVEPGARLAQDARVRIELTVRRSRWLGWLLGSTERVQSAFVTPTVALETRFFYPATGSPVEVHFSAPVSTVSIQLTAGHRRVLRLAPPRRVVPLGMIASGAGSAGSALVAGARVPWEGLPAAARVSWFPAAPTPEVMVQPAPTATLSPTEPITLTFSRPVGSVLGTRRPTLWPRPPGSWREPDEHTLVFKPRGLGFPLGAHVHLGLTRALRVLAGADPSRVRTISWHVPAGATGRLEQILGLLGYLPLTPPSSSAALPRTPSGLALAAVSRPAGTLAWRFGAPAALRRLWSSAQGRLLMLRGALMAFESADGLTVDGTVTPTLWNALLADELAGKRSPYGYSYVFVTETIPETLTLWHNGRVILRTPVNTGIPAAPTAPGTYPVYLHLASATMSGTNPDGQHYVDPGVPWVNYFNGGDAVHGFIRPGYGYPQSLGCVEAPIATAAQIWPYVQVGTLVTIAD